MKHKQAQNVKVGDDILSYGIVTRRQINKNGFIRLSFDSNAVIVFRNPAWVLALR